MPSLIGKVILLCLNVVQSLSDMDSWDMPVSTPPLPLVLLWFFDSSETWDPRPKWPAHSLACHLATLEWVGKVPLVLLRLKLESGRGGGWECFKQALKRKNHHWEKKPKIEKKLTNLLYKSQALELKSSHKWNWLIHTLLGITATVTIQQQQLL